MNAYRGTKERGPGPVPERWLKCPRKSINLLDNKFLAFKAPLNDRFNSQVPEEYRFPPEFVFMSMKSYKLKIGLWVDLTNTTRFYDKSEIEDNECSYVKLQCKGHGETPSRDQSRAFIQVCKNFISQHPLELIGVHCTHGFNRTGFLLVSYLVEVLDWDVDAAIAEFAKVRPPGIYKKDYLKELYERYDTVDFAPEPPDLPDWCTEYDDSVGDDPHDGDKGSQKRPIDSSEETSSHAVKRRREFVKNNAAFVEGVKGVETVQQPELAKIQRRVQDLCDWRKAGFPGSQPVSMEINNIRLLKEKPYKVSWKADGTRYMMYIQDKDKVYCIDRDNCVFKVTGLKFPYKKNLQVHVKDTLLDGELVLDKEGARCVPRYLIYDIVSIIGYPIRKDPFSPNRYLAIEKEIIQPRHEAIKQGLIDRQKEPFGVRLKQFYDIAESAKLLSDKFFKTLMHEPDGLIYQPAREPYQSGKCEDVLKWKPASHNSVDFKMKIAVETGVGIVPKKIGQLYVGGMEIPYGKLFPINKALAALDGKILECKWENNRWVFMRERTDKSFPNAFETANAVTNSIRNPVTKDVLIDFIEENRYLDLMPPPPVPF